MTNDVFPGENPLRSLSLMQLERQLQKTAELTYLDGKKQQTRYGLIYLNVSKNQKGSI